MSEREEDNQPSPSGDEAVPATGAELDLTPTEFRLWRTLSANPGRAFRRTELVALVMPDTVVSERTIDVHIQALRRKLGPLGRRIETIRKVGYRFTVEGRHRSEPSN